MTASLTRNIIYLLIMADNEMNYDHLAAGLKEALENDKSAFDADRLQKYTGTKCMIGIASYIVL